MSQRYKKWVVLCQSWFFSDRPCVFFFFFFLLHDSILECVFSFRSCVDHYHHPSTFSVLASVLFLWLCVYVCVCFCLVLVGLDSADSPSGLSHQSIVTVLFNNPNSNRTVVGAAFWSQFHWSLVKRQEYVFGDYGSDWKSTKPEVSMFTM